MMSGLPVRVLLNSITAAFVALGVVFWLKEPSVPKVSIPAAAASRPTGAPASRAASANAGSIVTSNMFSATRAAPSVRYTPSSAGGTSADVSAAESEVVTLPAPLPRVFGTMTGPNGATALMQLDSAGASSQLYREGERVGAFRIEKILTNAVVVRGPNGRVEIRVQQDEGRKQ